jgi:hypothetical protein
MKKSDKIVGIMQPYFFPFFEQFRLIASCDVWVAFDTVQFSRKSWITRNRILNREKGTSYISVPVRHFGLGTVIKDAQIDTDKDWRNAVLDKLKIYQHSAPFYSVARDLIADAMPQGETFVSMLNINALRSVCQYLDIGTPIISASSLTFDIPSECEPGEWALHISKSLDATEYRNAAGGVALFDSALYQQHGIRLRFHEHKPRTYHTGNFAFVQDLSIVDWLMWNSKEQLREWLL